MRAALLAALPIAVAAGSLAAADLRLSPPLDCDLGDDCFIQQYVDHDPSPEAYDYRCAPLSYNDHGGTDFALRSIEQMRIGVDVIASAPGLVRATREGMEDKIFTPADAKTMNGRECGNGVVIDHAGGWSTQYCHLKRGSITVRSGDRVETGTVLGQIGLSGRTQFPHVHLTVRKGDAKIDPFSPDGEVTCGAPSTETLWSTPLPYRPGGVLTVGFADAVPEYDAIKAGEAATPTLTTDAPAIVVFGHAFGAQAGDRMRLAVTGPGGTLIDETVPLERTQAQLFRAVGKRRTTEAWPSGIYRGVVTLSRGGRIINTETGQVVVR